MNPMNNVVQPFSEARLRLVMKDVAVDEVLEQRPQQDTQQKQEPYRYDRELALKQREVEHVTNHRNVQNQRGHGMHSRKKFHEIALEHSNRFVLIRDVKPLRHT